MSESEKSIDILFEKAVTIALQMPPLPPDIKLKFYAYYKQATMGNNVGMAAYTFSSDTELQVRNVFKFNAWKQLSNLSVEEAKEKYIQMVEEYAKVKIRS